MEKYNYMEAVTNDVLDYIAQNDITVNSDNRKEIEDSLNESLWAHAYQRAMPVAATHFAAGQPRKIYAITSIYSARRAPNLAARPNTTTPKRATSR